MSENAVSGHIQLIIPGESACFAVCGALLDCSLALWIGTGNVKISWPSEFDSGTADAVH